MLVEEKVNLLDAYVTKIKGEPVFKYGKWFVSVEANCYGSPTESELMFDTEEEARAVKIGHHYLT